MTITLSRAALEKLAKRPLKTAATHKADLYIVDINGTEAVVKDFAGKPLLTRWIGGAQISRECRAYSHLGAPAGIPRFLGRIDAYALAVEWIDGTELVASDTRFTHRRQHISGLRSVFDGFLAAGFLHLDSRGRHNVMIRESGDIVVVDLAGSLWLRPDGFLFRLLYPCCLRFYTAVLFKWRKLLTPSRFQRDERGKLARFFGYLRQPHHWLRRRNQK